MVQIVGAPCVKAGPSANGKHPAARLRPPVDGMVVNDVYMHRIVSEWGRLKPPAWC